jgi:putative SOS response-associated peptidase YedK
MCGRFDRHSELQTFAGLIDGLTLDDAPSLAASYNVAPSQEALVAIVDDDGRRRPVALNWGLVPSWSNKPELRRPINARVETVHQKPMFRTAFAKHRCLVFCDGYYEWAAGPGGKQPFYFRRPDARPMLLAGIFDRNTRLFDLPLRTFCVLTREAEGSAKEVHHRMPVIFDGECVERWLDPLADAGELRDMAESGACDELDLYPVSTFVNSPSNNSPRCIERESA